MTGFETRARFGRDPKYSGSILISGPTTHKLERLCASVFLFLIVLRSVICAAHVISCTSFQNAVRCHSNELCSGLGAQNLHRPSLALGTKAVDDIYRQRPGYTISRLFVSRSINIPHPQNTSYSTLSVAIKTSPPSHPNIIKLSRSSPTAVIHFQQKCQPTF